MADGFRRSASPAPVASARTRGIAHVLDNLFRIPGTELRFGVDPLLGLIPGIGDVVGGLLSTYILAEAVRSGASSAVLLRMFANMGIDMLFAAVPLLGDLFDAGWKANSKNLALLQRHLDEPDAAASASRAFILALSVGVIALLLLGAFVAVLFVRFLLGALG